MERVKKQKNPPNFTETHQRVAGDKNYPGKFKSFMDFFVFGAWMV